MKANSHQYYQKKIKFWWICVIWTTEKIQGPNTNFWIQLIWALFQERHSIFLIIMGF